MAIDRYAVDDATNQLFTELHQHLVAAGMEPAEPRHSPDDIGLKLRGHLGADPAPVVEAWFGFTERWPLQMVEPSMGGWMDIDSAIDHLAEHIGFGVEPSALLAPAQPTGAPDLVPVGIEPSGSIFVVSPATVSGAATDDPRMCGFEFGESFFFRGDDVSVQSRADLPTVLGWLRELNAAHADRRIVPIGHGGFGMANAEWDGQKQDYPWPLFD